MRTTMRLYCALSAAALASVDAWVPLASRQRSSFFRLATNKVYSSSSSRLYATVENVTKETGAVSTGNAKSDGSLQPEYAAVLQTIRDQLNAKIPEHYHAKMYPLVSHFAEEYVTACQTSYLSPGNEKYKELSRPEAVGQRFLQTVQMALRNGMGNSMFQFKPLHRAVRGLDPENENGITEDYYAYGNDFFRACIDIDNSLVHGQDNLDKLMNQLEQGHNVVLFANHQTEADPQVVSILLEEKTRYGEESANTIFVAGHKVTTDPLAVSFSMGRNLICIHSKKHIASDPETKSSKQKENLRAMSAMLEQFKRGGTLIWIAPSGGRDRRNVETGEIPISPFDSKTIDMFRLIGNKSKVPTHYYTMAMVTYDLVPPPDFVEAGVGESRHFEYVSCGIAVGEECKSVGGLESRQTFRNHAFEQCNQDYQKLYNALRKD